MNNRILKSAVLVAATLVVPGLASAAGDAAAGKAKSATCAACHGANGKAMIPNYPNLAGQNAAYLESSLKAYKNKERSGGMAALMAPQAAMLSDADIANLAAYYSSL
ncbi:c-type cytochrome [Parendozoicomonas haliclonae]|uniref:Cytochrome c-554(548) n=1 Tax=Parendozoicomonas haliclonae TaxID=1960125 RepID=A0A1X7AFK6_9GAMM|nr:cytochrome c [Parendozoicomonas haliclonae]SMA37690.1 Cytochrome c-554(548) [Parendozoicomonas haliclonae]